MRGGTRLLFVRRQSLASMSSPGQPFRLVDLNPHSLARGLETHMPFVAPPLPAPRSPFSFS